MSSATFRILIVICQFLPESQAVCHISFGVAPIQVLPACNTPYGENVPDAFAMEEGPDRDIVTFGEHGCYDILPAGRLDAFAQTYLNLPPEVPQERVADIFRPEELTDQPMATPSRSIPEAWCPVLGSLLTLLLLRRRV